MTPTDHKEVADKLRKMRRLTNDIVHLFIGSRASTLCHRATDDLYKSIERVRTMLCRFAESDVADPWTIYYPGEGSPSERPAPLDPRTFAFHLKACDYLLKIEVLWLEIRGAIKGRVPVQIEYEFTIGRAGRGVPPTLHNAIRQSREHLQAFWFRHDKTQANPYPWPIPHEITAESLSYNRRVREAAEAAEAAR